jgi:Tfp pilus assembly protein PilX
MPRPTRPIARGSALAVSIILIGVLTVIGVAAVSLSTQERANAAAYGRVDSITACANAAIAKLWKEIAVTGTGLSGSSATVSSIRLPDGTLLTAPAHYDTLAGGTIPTVGQMTSTRSSSASKQKTRNLTNQTPATVQAGQTQIFTAHCKDASGRELEIEIGIRFAL